MQISVIGITVRVYFDDVEQECCKQPLYRMDTTGSQVNPKLCVSYASHFVCEASFLDELPYSFGFKQV